MTATAIKTKKTKSAPFQSQTRPGRTLRSAITSAPLPATACKEQEQLSDWAHCS